MEGMDPAAPLPHATGGDQRAGVGCRVATGSGRVPVPPVGGVHFGQELQQADPPGLLGQLSLGRAVDPSVDTSKLCCHRGACWVVTREAADGDALLDSCLLRDELDAPEAGDCMQCCNRQTGASAVHAHQIPVVRDDGGRDVEAPHRAGVQNLGQVHGHDHSAAVWHGEIDDAADAQVAVQVPGGALHAVQVRVVPMKDTGGDDWRLLLTEVPVTACR